jgi:hypothetical protein
MQRDRVGFVAVTPDAPTWRRLQPLLKAFAGPTLTDFDGMPRPPDPGHPVGMVLSTVQIDTTAAIRPHDDGVSTLDSLLTLIALLEEAPAGDHGAPESTARMLARLDAALLAGDRASADADISRLRDEARLDLINLACLRVRLRGAFGEYAAIRADADFVDLCRAPVPLAVKAELLRALDAVELAPLAQDQAGLRNAYRTRVRPFAQSLLSLPFGEPTASIQRMRDLEAELTGAAPARRLTDPVDAAKAAVIGAEVEATLDAASQAIRLVEALSEDERRALIGNWLQRGLISVVGQSFEKPLDWHGWLDAVAAGEAPRAHELARKITDETRAADLVELEDIRRLAAAIVAGRGDVAQAQFVDALPLLAEWLSHDPAWPRPALQPVHLALLQETALAEGGGGDVRRRVAAVLIDAVLAIGLDASTFRQDVLGTLELLVPEGLGRDTIPWVFELIEGILRYDVPDAQARRDTISLLVGRILASGISLFPAQARLLRELCYDVSVNIPTIREDSTAEAALGAVLAGRRIAVYSLTVEAAKRARTLLLDLVPRLRIDLHHEHVASAELQRSARVADLFVIAAGSAKHSATDAIRRHRGNRPIVYAAGKGASSIIRAVEQFVSEGYALE